MSVDLFRIHGDRKQEKSRDQGIGPSIELAGCPDKIHVGTAALGCPASEARHCFAYAVRLGRTVKSRNWVRTLDICIPFSCETNGRISAIN
jgi:hypothetical protein